MTSDEFEARVFLLGFSAQDNRHSDATWTSWKHGIEIQRVSARVPDFAVSYSVYSVDAYTSRTWSGPLPPTKAYQRLLDLITNLKEVPWDGS